MIIIIVVYVATENPYTWLGVPGALLVSAAIYRFNLITNIGLAIFAPRLHEAMNEADGDLDYPGPGYPPGYQAPEDGPRPLIRPLGPRPRDGPRDDEPGAPSRDMGYLDEIQLEGGPRGDGQIHPDQIEGAPM